MVPGLVDGHTCCGRAMALKKSHGGKKASLTQTSHPWAVASVSPLKRTRNSSHDALFALGYERLRTAMRTGTTHMEAKSGYGLSTDTELKLLDVMHRLNGVGHLPSIDPNVDGCPRRHRV